MKKMVFVLVSGLLCSQGQSQSILDLTEQLALDVQKLSSLKATLQDMYGGYEQLETGYSNIRNIVRDNFNLHKAFLDALWVLSPAVHDDPRLGGILDMTAQIMVEYQRGQDRFGGNPVFTRQELAYITGTLGVVLKRSEQAIEELNLVTTDNTLRMSDAQRLQAIDRIDAQVKGDLIFLRQFNNSLSLEAARRQKEAGEINILKSLYGIPN